MPDWKVGVDNPGIEDSCVIHQAICLRQSQCKAVFFYVASVFTLGFFWLLGYWSPVFKSRMMFNKCSALQASHFLVLNWDNKWAINVRQDKLVLGTGGAYKQTISFTNRHIGYFYDQAKETFQSYKYDTATRLNQIGRGQLGIYQGRERDILLRQFGPCLVQVQVDSKLKLFVSQVLSPYQVFQFYAIIYWLLTDYYIFPIILLAISLYTYLSDISLLQQGQMELKADTLISVLVTYVAESAGVPELQSFHSETLVPGDLFYIRQNQKLPCDCIILQGSAYVNEEYLTGDPLPSKKSEVEGYMFDPVKEADSTLYMGTEIIEIQEEWSTNSIAIPKPQFRALLCLVVRTNYGCVRGQYLRNILFPKPNVFKLFTESMGFLVILLAINVVGFLCAFVKVKHYVGSQKTLQMFLDLLTTAIPPTLPTAMNIGIGFAMQRLRALNIRCMVKQKILIGGRVDTLLIQKSGILTKNQLKAVGFIPSVPLSQMGLTITSQGSMRPQDSDSLIGMAVTHSVSKSKETGSLLGRPIDVEMFRFSKGEITDHNNQIRLGDMQIQVERRFWYSNETNIMGVIAATERRKSLFVKGRPEKILPLCSLGTMSSNTHEILKELGVKGFKVVALACKQLGDRDQIKSLKGVAEFSFLGFFVLEDKMEPDSPQMVQALLNSNIHVAILSKGGSMSVSYSATYCGILNNRQLIHCDLEVDPSGSKRVSFAFPIQHKSTGDILEDKSRDTTEKQHRVSYAQDQFVRQLALYGGDSPIVQICMTGLAFQELSSRNTTAISYILQRTTIFCNLQQRHYAMIVEVYQKMGKLVSLVGDNVRDNSFKQADVGLTLTAHQLSYLSHFSASKTNIGSVINLLRVCKATLSCNFQTFRMMCLFSLTEFTTSVILFMNYQTLNDTQNLYIDLFIMCPIFVSLCLTQPCSKLSKRKPSASLFSVANVLSMTGLFLIQLTAQLLFFSSLKTHNDSLGDILKSQDFSTDTQEAASIFVFSNFLYIGIGLATSVSRPFRKEFYTNTVLVINILALWIYNSLIPFDLSVIPKSMGIQHLQGDRVVTIILSANIVCLVMYLYEYMVLWIAKKSRTRWNLD